MDGRVLLFVGPDGAGRYTLAEAIGITLHIPRVVSYTTRAKRPHELDGREYHFVSEAEFLELEQNESFIEVVRADGISYGIKRSDCEQLLQDHGSFFAILSPEGCEIFKRLFANTLTIFVHADQETVIERQKLRGDDPQTIERHLSHYAEINAYQSNCDIVIPNYDLASTAQELTNRIEAFLGITHHPDSRY